MRRRIDALTAREREVLALLRLGLTDEEIARRLGITLDGATYRVSQILSKLGVSSREQAAAVAVQRRRWGAAWPRWTKIAGAATVVAALAGLAVLAWGVLGTDGGAPSDQPGPSPVVQSASAPDPTPNHYPAWSLSQRNIVRPLPEGHLLLSRGGSVLYSLAERNVVDLSQYGFTVSPDGSYAASYLEPPADEGTRIAVKDVDGASLVIVDGDWIPRPGPWSPDGSRLIVTMAGGRSFKLLDIPSGQVREFDLVADRLTYSPDGLHILVWEVAGVSCESSCATNLVNSETGQVTQIPFRTSAPDGYMFSPDGRYLAFMTGGGAPGQGPWQPGILDTATGRSCVVAPATRYSIKMGNQGGPGLTWSPDSRLLAITDESGYARGFAYTRVDVAEPDSCAVQTVATLVVDFDWSPDGQTLALSIFKDDETYLSAGAAGLNIWSRGDGLRPLGVDAWDPIWAPDGSRIVARNEDMLRVIDLDDLSTTDLPGAPNMYGPWSPSGRYLILVDHDIDWQRFYLLDLETLQSSPLLEDHGLYSLSIEAWAR